MAYHVEFSEPVYDRNCDQWIIIGSLDLKIDGEHYRTLTIKHWLSHEARYNQNWFRLAKQHIRQQLEERATRETRAALQYRTPEVGSFDRIAIPNVRRIYPQLIANDIVSIQPMRGPSPVLEYYQRFQYSQTRNGGSYRRVPIEEFSVNWLEEGF